MTHQLPVLPYAQDALGDVMSAQTLQFHHGKHHQTYVDNLNKLIPGTEYEHLPLEDIVKKAPDGPVFNNAAQVWNHTFFFEALCAPGTSAEAPCSYLAEQFGSYDAFKDAFVQSATGLFGSGWTWLVKDDQGKLSIVNESNAGNPLRKGLTPILCVDVWEHAYYLDYQNRRAEYLKRIWEILDWTILNKRCTCCCK